MQEDAINVFCLSHGVSFPTLGSNRVVICKENHVLSYNFPHSGRWFYCSLCQKYWVAPKGEGGQDAFSKQCPSCNLIKKARYYSCDQCNVTMIDSLGAINRKGIHITPWGTPHPHCPGCHQLPKTIPQSHACPELNGLLTSARAECPFCEGQERAEVAVGKEESGGETEKSRVGSADEFVAPGPPYVALDELERKAAEIKALEVDAEARQAKAQERLRQVEAKLRQEMSRRSELERKSLEIEEELKRQPEIERGRVELLKKASEIAQFEEERKARIAAEQAKAEIEAKLRQMEARVSESEERLGQAEANLQQEAAALSLAEEKANELEIRGAAENAKVMAEAEAKIQGIGAETRRIEENYKAEIDWISTELERVAASAKQADENHRAEMARIIADAESRARQSDAHTRQQYQIKVEEAIANAQAAMFNLEETRKILDEAEARYRDMETRARQAETRSRRLYLISKLSFVSAEQVIAEILDASDENEKDAMVIPIDLAADTYSDDFSSEMPGANGLMDYEDYPFSDRMRALFEAAARANTPDDKSG